MQKVKVMKKYADLIAEKGIQAQRRPDVAIVADVEMHEFVGYLVSELFKYGIKHIDVMYRDAKLLRQFLMNTPETRLPQLANRGIQEIQDFAQRGASLIELVGESVETNRRFPFDKYESYAKARQACCDQCLRPYFTNEAVHCSAIVPTRSWAEDLYPDLTPVQAFKRFWEELSIGARLDNALNAFDSYDGHVKDMKAIQEILNQRRFARLHLKDGKGTDFTVNLPLGHFWQCGVYPNSWGEFVAHLPDEAMVVSPHSHGTSGVVKAGGPVYYHGEKIEGIELTFEGGKVVDAKASSNEEALKAALETDDFAVRVGKLGLVSQKAPIAPFAAFTGSKVLVENSCSFIGLGQSDSLCHIGGLKMDATELRKNGMNQSDLSLDIPLPRTGLTVIGETDDGQSAILFKDSDWAL